MPSAVWFFVLALAVSNCIMPRLSAQSGTCSDCPGAPIPVFVCSIDTPMQGACGRRLLSAPLLGRQPIPAACLQLAARVAKIET